MRLVVDEMKSLALSLLVFLALVGCGSEPTPTPTTDFQAGDDYMKNMPCDEVLRWDEAALNDLDDGYNSYTNMAIIVNRLAQNTGELSEWESVSARAVEDRVQECAPGTPGYAYLQTEACEFILDGYELLSEEGWAIIEDTGQSGEWYAPQAADGLAVYGVGLFYREEGQNVSTRDAKERIIACGGSPY